MIPTPWDMMLLKRTCFGEARDQGDAGMLAQAWSMINRHAAGKWYSGQTYADMCLMAVVPSYPQYDCWLAYNAARKPIVDSTVTVTVTDDDPTMIRCTRAVEAALSGAQPDPTNGATHYYDNSILPPTWASPPAVRTVQIGKLIFYKGVR